MQTTQPFSFVTYKSRVTQQDIIDCDKWLNGKFKILCEKSDGFTSKNRNHIPITHMKKIYTFTHSENPNIEVRIKAVDLIEAAQVLDVTVKDVNDYNEPIVTN